MFRSLKIKYAAALLLLLSFVLAARAQKISFTPGLVTTYAGDPTSASGFNPAYSGLPVDTNLETPVRIAIDANGNVYFLETAGGVVRVVVAKDGTVPLVPGAKAGNLYPVAGNGTTTATGACATSSDPTFGEDCPAPQAAFNSNPNGLAVDASGNIYIADTFNQAIRVVFAGGSVPGLNRPTPGNIYRIAGVTGQFGDSPDPGPALTAQLTAPGGMDVDAHGNLYFADTGNNIVRVLFSGGSVPGIPANAVSGYLYTIAGQPGLTCANPTDTASPCGDSASASQSFLTNPDSVKLDPYGNIFITDTGDYRLRVVFAGGSVAGLPFPGDPALIPGDIYTASGNGESEPGTPQNGVPAVGTPQFSNSMGQVFVDAAGNITLPDAGASSIRRIAPDGIIQSFPTTFTQLGGVVENSAGNLFITSFNLVQEMDLSQAGLSFQNQNVVVGQNSPTEVVTVTNTDTITLTISSTSAGTNGFAVVPSGGTDCTAGTSLAQGQSCEIGVILSAQTQIPTDGGVVTGSIAVGSNAVNATNGNSTIALLATVGQGSANVALTASSVIVNAGQPVTFTATATAFGGGIVIPTGTVDFTISASGSNATFPVTLNAQGVATYTATGLQPIAGGYTIVANYNSDQNVIPDPNFAAASSGNVNLLVSSIQVPTVSITASSAAISAGDSVTLTATVTPYSGSVTPMGTITFSDGVGLLPSATVPLSGGSATYSTTGLKPGTNILVANYSGDANYLGARSPGAPVTVAPPASVAQLNVSPGIISTVYTPAVSSTPPQPLLISVVASPTGDLYFADFNDNVVLKQAAGSGQAVIVAGIFGQECSTGSNCGDGGPATSATLWGPSSLALDAYGNLFIDDGYDGAIRRVGKDGNIQTVAGVLGSLCSGLCTNNGQLATTAQIPSDIGIALDASGNLYLVPRGGTSVSVVSASTGILSTIAGGGTDDPTSDLAINAALPQLDDLVVDPNGNIYLAAANNILRVDGKTNILTTIAGTGLPCTAAPCGDGGPAIQAAITNPYGIQMDAAGDIYFADSGINTVRKIDASGTITTIAGAYPINGNGFQGGYSGDGGLATAAQLSSPVSLSFDSAGNLYLIDQGNIQAANQNQGVVREITGPGTILNFGTVPLGGQPAVPLVFSNTGGAPLAFTAIDLPSNYVLQMSSQRQSSDCDSTIQLAPGANCALNVQFFPTQAGQVPAGNAISVASNAANSTGGVNTIPIEGTATAAATGTTPQTITFPPLAASSTVSYGTPIALAATASGSTAANPLPVQYRVTGPALAEPPPPSSPSSLFLTGIGTVTVTAVQFGNSVYAAAPPVTQTLTVTPATLTVTAVSTSRSIDTPNPVFTSTIVGLVNGDMVQGAPVLSTTATQSSPGGTYPITITQGTLTFPDTYTLNLVPGTLQVVTGTAPQSITSFAPITNAVYGGVITPVATASSGLTVTFTAQGPLTPSADGLHFTSTGTGPATITANQFGNDTYAPATPVAKPFTIAQAPLTIQANNATKVQGSPNPAFSYTPTGFVDGDTQLVLTGQPNYVVQDDDNSPPSTYRIGISRGTLSATNYNLVTSTYVPGTLTITAGAPQTITFPPLPNVLYGTAPITLQASSSSGLPITYSLNASSNNSLSGSTLTLSRAGTVSVTASQPGGPGFAAATPVTQTFTVLPVPLTLTAINQTEVAGLVNLGFLAQAIAPVTGTGFVNGDNIVGLASQNPVALSTTATYPSPPGVYPIVLSVQLTQGGAYAENYSPVTIQNGTLTIVAPTGAPDYTLTSATQTLVVPQGQLRQTTISLTPVNDYQGTVSLSCGSLPAGVTCTLDPAAITLATDNFVPTTHNGTLTISAGVPLSSTARNREPISSIGTASFWLPGLISAAVVGVTRRKYAKRSRVLLLFIVFAGTSILLGLGACSLGSSSSSGGLPQPGTVTVAIQASDASQNITHTLNLTLTIE